MRLSYGLYYQLDHTSHMQRIKLPGGVLTAEQIEARIRRALEVVPADRLLVAPDCGLGYFSRTAAYAKLRNMGQAAAAGRQEPQLVLTRYGVERLLYRLSRIPEGKRFVLKGAALFYILGGGDSPPHPRPRLPGLWRRLAPGRRRGLP